MTNEEMEQLLREVGVPVEQWAGAKETMKLGFVPTKCVIGEKSDGGLVTVVFEPLPLEE